MSFDNSVSHLIIIIPSALLLCLGGMGVAMVLKKIFLFCFLYNIWDFH